MLSPQLNRSVVEHRHSLEARTLHEFRRKVKYSCHIEETLRYRDWRVYRASSRTVKLYNRRTMQVLEYKVTNSTPLSHIAEAIYAYIQQQETTCSTSKTT